MTPGGAGNGRRPVGKAGVAQRPDHVWGPRTDFPRSVGVREPTTLRSGAAIEAYRLARMGVRGAALGSGSSYDGTGIPHCGHHVASEP